MQSFSGRNLTCLRGERVVLQAIDFEVVRGGALLLTGPNGSGKSSLLRLMAGLIRPAAGTLYWNDEDVRGDIEAHRARVAYVGHLDAVKPMLTVRENVAFWAELAGSSAGDAVESALDAFGISHLADLPARLLSQGQRRRTNLARLLAASAPLWLLDEPTVGLDTDATASVEAAITKHRDKGGIVVAATHLAMLPSGVDRLDLTSPPLSPELAMDDQPQ